MAEARTPVILIVDDDVELCASLAAYLAAHSMEVRSETSGARAVERIRAERPDLVLLDIVLPEVDGFSVCRQVRHEFSGPIVMLTGGQEELDEIVGLELGADDYLTKPVSPRRLLARIRSKLRRGSGDGPLAGAGSDDRPLVVATGAGELAMSQATREASFDGERLGLTTGEFDTLWYLACRAGQIVSREAMASELRGVDYDASDRSLDIRVARLRQKLGRPRGARVIKTIRGVGYQLTQAHGQ